MLARKPSGNMILKKNVLLEPTASAANTPVMVSHLDGTDALLPTILRVN
jgi:hypothetical protein